MARRAVVGRARAALALAALAALALLALLALLAGAAEAKKQGEEEAVRQADRSEGGGEVAPSPPSPGRAHGAGPGEVSPDSLLSGYDHERWEIDPDEVELGEMIGEGE